MIAQLKETDLALVLDFKFRKLEETGRCPLPANWRQHSTERYQNLYSEGKCLHLGYLVDNRVIASAGAMLCDETPFLSVQPVRHGLLIDEYVLPEYRNQAIAGKLRDNLLVWLTKKGARLTATIPPNLARLACAAGNFRL